MNKARNSHLVAGNAKPFVPRPEIQSFTGRSEGRSIFYVPASETIKLGPAHDHNPPYPVQETTNDNLEQSGASVTSQNVTLQRTAQVTYLITSY